MKIAISGTHFSGKTTLAEALFEVLPDYTLMEEPYYQLTEEGHDFGELPSIEDFVLMLERSIENLDESAQNSIFDRCPADMLGYLLSQSDAEAFDLKEWLPRALSAISKLDLIVFLPIETPDRIVLPLSQDIDYRERVDKTLQEIIVENRFSFAVDVLEATGSLHERVEQVLAHIRNRTAD
ncbi:MAG TPA: ATP-binding protein [Nitrospirota bacterium]|nr:ATP-binding protein [Nitrospirota bacterium]